MQGFSLQVASYPQALPVPAVSLRFGAERIKPRAIPPELLFPEEVLLEKQKGNPIAQQVAKQVKDQLLAVNAAGELEDYNALPSVLRLYDAKKLFVKVPVSKTTLQEGLGLLAHSKKYQVLGQPVFHLVANDGNYNGTFFNKKLLPQPGLKKKEQKPVVSPEPPKTEELETPVATAPGPRTHKVGTIVSVPVPVETKNLLTAIGANQRRPMEPGEVLKQLVVGLLSSEKRSELFPNFFPAPQARESVRLSEKMPEGPR